MSQVVKEYVALEDAYFNSLFVEKDEVVKALPVQMKYLGHQFKEVGETDEPVTTADQPLVTSEAVAPITAALKTRGFTATSSNPTS